MEGNTETDRHLVVGIGSGYLWLCFLQTHGGAQRESNAREKRVGKKQMQINFRELRRKKSCNPYPFT